MIFSATAMPDKNSSTPFSDKKVNEFKAIIMMKIFGYALIVGKKILQLEIAVRLKVVHFMENDRSSSYV